MQVPMYTDVLAFTLLISHEDGT